MRILKILGVLIALYVLVGFSLDAAIGYFQPQSETTVVLRSYDDSGAMRETVLGLRDDNGQLWVESGHWFRGWYYRCIKNPNVELTFFDGETKPFTAVPINTPEAVEHMTVLMGKGDGAGYWVGRAMLLFAPIKPVRLDSREPT